MASTSSYIPFASTRITRDVFLSFCAVDSQYKFTSHLQAALNGHGFRTFMGDLDDPDPSNGKVISQSLLQAINGSKVFIVVFSENYAASPRRLDELLGIYRFRGARLVIPVFYNSNPTMVQQLTGSYKKAFRKHEASTKTGWFEKAPRYHIRFAQSEKLKRWRLALTGVAGFSGETVSADRSESDVINQVVNKVLSEIKTMILDVTKYPVGLDSRVGDIISLLSNDTEAVTRIGIYGMGGIGKTTLAKAVYNQIYYSFQGSSFLENVSEISKTAKGVVCLQQKLINDILRSEKIKIDSVDQGIELIRARICLTKALVVIDDLDDPRPLEFLGPFALGSVVIITTRNEDVLDSIKVKAKYKANELSAEESWQLFTKHAFRDIKISYRFNEVSEQILNCAGGLPLALEVFGSNLYKKSEEEWTCIDKLKQDSIDDIEKKLAISFDALKLVDPILQDIFLDIACFFIGWYEEEVVEIMETCYTFVNRSIDILKKRCLLTINCRHELEMHDLLRDMGRKIAGNNSPNEPEKHSRLWVSGDIYDILKNHKGTKAIEGIVSSNFNYKDALAGPSFNTETFKRMSKLRFLSLKNVVLTGSFEETFDELRWLSWDGCPLRCLPPEFYPQKLVILELLHSKLERMWELNMDLHVFGKLRTINMSYSLHLTTTPDFTKLPSLETLNLEYCESLEEVHVSIGSLVRLVSLNLCKCVSLKGLPDSICNLRALKNLNIGGCSNLEALPMELWDIESLTEFHAEGLNVLNLIDRSVRISEIVEMNSGEHDYLKTPSHSASVSTYIGWDVFLSFCNDDTGLTFTRHLYDALDSLGIGTFKDDTRLVGKAVLSGAVLQAIQKSNTYIVVLSENYAASSYCLDELVEILHSKRTMKKLVIPVYYNITASSVRLQTGSYGKAFEKHQIRYKGGMEKVNRWRLSLTEISSFSGYHISESRNELDTVEEIVKYMAALSNRKVFHLDKYLFGIDSAVTEIYQMLRLESIDVRVVGICGMGGIGKTTIAKAFCNKYSNRFDINCFLKIENQHSQEGVMLALLEQMLAQVHRIKIYRVTNVQSEIRILENILSSQKTLIVLDDLLQQSTLSLLRTLRSSLSPGSRIIITTRDGNLLNQLNIDMPEVDIYMVKTLGRKDSSKLFISYAFGNKMRPKSFKILSESFVTYADGLPLALKVFGSSLLGRYSMSFWKAKLKKVQEIPEKQIQDILQLSYDELDEVEKAIFLNIACFFVGEDIGKAFHLFKSENIFPQEAVPVLVKRCLLTVDRNNKFQMHNLIQVMGRELAKSRPNLLLKLQGPLLRHI